MMPLQIKPKVEWVYMSVYCRCGAKRLLTHNCLAHTATVAGPSKQTAVTSSSQEIAVVNLFFVFFLFSYCYTGRSILSVYTLAKSRSLYS